MNLAPDGSTVPLPLPTGLRLDSDPAGLPWWLPAAAVGLLALVVLGVALGAAIGLEAVAR